MMQATAAIQQSVDGYFAVPTSLLVPDARGGFSIYLKQERGFVLYAKEDEAFTMRHRMQLRAHGVTQVFVPAPQHPSFISHRERHFGRVLSDDSLPLPERARLFYETSTEIVKEVFEKKLPRTLKRETFDRILALVSEGISFLTLENSLKTVASLVAHDYHTYSHSLHVFVYSQALLQSYGFDEDSLVQFGLGAMLHDIGKTFLDAAILTKPAALTPDEREEVNRHPVFGVGACARMPLSQDAINCILFHHEKLDGSGYPLRTSRRRNPPARPCHHHRRHLRRTHVEQGLRPRPQRVPGASHHVERNARPARPRHVPTVRADALRRQRTVAFSPSPLPPPSLRCYLLWCTLATQGRTRRKQHYVGLHRQGARALS